MSEIIQLTFEEIEAYAHNFALSGLFKDARDMEQAFVKVAAGQELGIPPFASMSGIHVIKGKPTLSANMLAALVRRTGIYDFDVMELTNEICRLRFYRLVVREGQTRELGESVFTIEDARTAEAEFEHSSGNAGAWTKFPRNMLYARALSNGVKWFCPEVASGMPIYHPEEMGARVDENDNVIEPVSTSQPAPARKAKTRMTTPRKHDHTKVVDAAEPEKISGAQVKELVKVVTKLGFTADEKDRERLAAFVNHYTGRDVDGVKDLTAEEAERFINDAALSGKLAEFIANQEIPPIHETEDE